MRIATLLLRRRLVTAAFVLFAAPAAAQNATPVTAPADAATAPSPRVPGALPIADYARWRSISSPALSPDGQWMAWSYTQVRRDDELHVKHIDSGREHVVARASRPLFSGDGRWVAYSVAPTIKDIDKAEKDKKPVIRRVELMDLTTGEKVGWDDATSFAFAETSSHLAVKKNRPEPKPKHEGADLILRDLRNGRDELIGGVVWHTFNKPGALLAYATDGADMDGNGLYLVDLATGTRRTLDNAKAKYTRAVWSKEGNSLAVLRGVDVDTLANRANTLVAFTAVRGVTAKRSEIAIGSPKLPAGFVISDKAALDWNDAGDRLFFGVKAQEHKPKKKELEDWMKASDVNVFHAGDDRLQTQQAKQAESDRNRTDRAALLIGGEKIVVLQDSTLRSMQIGGDGRWAIAWDDRAFVSDWEESRADYYRIDVATGARTPFLKAQMRTLGMSPAGDRYLYWKDGHVWSYDIARDRHVNLTADVPVDFTNAEWDYLSTKPPYGVTGFTKDRRGVILNHRYDLWYVPFDGGKPRVLTAGIGSEREIRFGYVRLDPEEEYIDLSKPVLLSAYGQWTKKAGFYELDGSRMRELVFTDNMYGSVQKARNADRVVYTRQSWNEFPDLHVASHASNGGGLAMADARVMTNANPQQSEYAWGRRILFDYTNKDGVKLQGTLAIPSSWQPGQRLPMLVSFYEKYSQNLHLYPVPRYSSGPQFAGYVSDGYLVMQPDVHFRGGSSHSDMLECVEAAIAKVVELGYADPARVGLHGHSYSGGGASYIATRSKAFAAIVAGAAPINLVAEFNILFRGSGQNNHQYDIYGQGRYGSNPYDDFDRYWTQSPISGVRGMDTPLLYMHGEDDQIVEYNQGMEFYNALRFNKKPVIFLSYPGEGHSLSKLENNLDYLTRMEQFYGHYLKGEPMPSWMRDGERFIDKSKRDPIVINTGATGDVLTASPATPAAPGSPGSTTGGSPAPAGNPGTSSTPGGG